MLNTILKLKAVIAALSVKSILLPTVPVLLLTLLTTGTAQASSFEGGITGLLFQTPPAMQCYPVPQQGGNGLDGTPPLSINPVDWIGWVLGQLCKAVATVFFTLTNQVINWGSGCSQAGINFVSQTPNYIRLDASKSGNWQLFFWDGALIGALLLLQFTWTALSIIWNRQMGNGYAGAQETVTRTVLGSFLLVMSGILLEWSVAFCNLLNSLFAGRLTLFDPNAFQVDANGNIFNTVLSIAAAFASLLLVMQMATRYIYLALLQFIFPVGVILWMGRGTQGYARLLFTSFVATLFVQPLQLAAIYITSNLKDGTRDDTSLNMLFGICGLFLALGLPRVMGSVLGGGTPVGAWGIFAIGRMAASGVGSAVRSSSRASGSSGSGGNSNSSGGRGPAPTGGNGGAGPGGGRASRGSTLSNSLPGGTAGRSSQNATGTGGSNMTQSAAAGDESLRHGGLGQGAFRNTAGASSGTRNGQSLQNSQASSPSNSSSSASTQEGEASIPPNASGSSFTPNSTITGNSNSGASSLPVGNQSTGSDNSQVNLAPGGTDGTSKETNTAGSRPAAPGPATNMSSPSTQAGPGNSQAAAPTTIYRNRNGEISRSSLGKNTGELTPSEVSHHSATGSLTSNSTQAASSFIAPAQAERLASSPTTRQSSSTKNLRGEVNNDGL